jgi:hypothetical protein
MNKTIPYKEVNKKLNAGLKLVREAIAILKSHVVIAEVVFPSAPKAIRTRKVKEARLPDADAKGYMKERKEVETD